MTARIPARSVVHRLPTSPSARCRHYQSPPPPPPASEPEPALQHSIRALFRRTAQPVAVLTTLLPPSPSDPGPPKPTYHGATLSSFTSISLAPLPLVAFSLRLPSRAAQAIDRSFSAASYPRASLVVNMLSAEQAELARHFSRPDLYPEPWGMHEFALSEEGVPVFPGSLGALSCTPVTSFPLDWGGLRKLGVNVGPEMVQESRENTSELFIAQVVRVELKNKHGSHPLLYQDRVFKAVGEELPLSENGIEKPAR
ncbi:hypothetical protein CALCODRAFT_515759 [Calocera cornea HHB12733]|uniref:Flavin reductase like domain-containing protein n=1 Tax=Calocera cornea HHB12733 TaxID=1353952 RepID=A0A165HWG7_9BASI|nr:hypothetical protein CALCODRAFT_515759 [Calocera cornea HHB12733]